MFFITILNSSDKVTLKEYITNFFNSIKQGKVISIYKTLINNNLGILITALLSFSIILFPLVIVIIFYKGFTLAFTITSLIYTFKIKGIILTFFYVFPSLIFNLVFYFIMCYYSFKLSLILFNRVINKESTNINKFLKKYLIVILVCVAFVSLFSLYDTYLLPSLIKLVY
jgi:stage II sporulation protein M